MTTTEIQRLGQPAIEGATPAENDLQLWSVTTIIGAMDKPALLYWASEQAALAAIHSESTWRGMLADDEHDCHHDSPDCAAVKWLRDARFRRPKGVRSATELGTLVHDACEQYALTGSKPTEVDAEVAPFLDQFDEWLHRFQPSYQATEVAVYHPELGYAGTADCFLTIDGVRYIGDYKSTRKHLDSRGKPTVPYPEQVGLQLAAYRHAQYAAVWRPRRAEKFRRRYYLLGPDEQALAQQVPQVDTGLVIHITPQACEAYPIVCDTKIFDAYLGVQDTARWLFQDSKTVMGNPLMETTP
ncbi:MAG: hypothetical protein ACRDQG_14255 [Pseudonocardiaceae bacterium]